MTQAEPSGTKAQAILIIDDMPSIHDDFNKIFRMGNGESALESRLNADAELFSTAVHPDIPPRGQPPLRNSSRLGPAGHRRSRHGSRCLVHKQPV